MNPARRRVVLDPDFYPILATQLPLDRTATRPSIADFADYEIPRIVRRFEDDWESQVPFAGLANAREAWIPGRIVFAYTVVVQFRDDGNLHLMRIEIDFEDLPDPGEDEGLTQ